MSNPRLVFFLWKVSNPGSQAPKLQEDWLGTKDEIGSSNVHLDSSNLHLDLVPQELILVTAPKLQEDWIGTLTGYQHKFMSIKSISLLKPGATRCHGTRIARGVPLPVYINLDLYSGFWCTSHCVVFKYSVPPLTDQALRKVLLTSWKEVNYCCLVSKRFIECPI